MLFLSSLARLHICTIAPLCMAPRFCFAVVIVSLFFIQIVSNLLPRYSLDSVSNLLQLSYQIFKPIYWAPIFGYWVFQFWNLYLIFLKRFVFSTDLLHFVLDFLKHSNCSYIKVCDRCLHYFHLPRVCFYCLFFSWYSAIWSFLLVIFDVMQNTPFRKTVDFMGILHKNLLLLLADS